MRTYLFHRTFIGLTGAFGFVADTLAQSPPGGTVVYAPLATSSQSIPTLSTTMMALLGILLSLAVYKVLRAKNRPFAILIAAGVCLATASGGTRILGEVQANGATHVPMSAGGGSYGAAPGILTQFDNNTGNSLTIVSVTPNTDLNCQQVVPTNSGACTNGLPVANGASCQVQFICDSNPT